MKKLIYLLSSLLIIISVNIIFAQTNTPLGEVKGLVIGISNIAFNVVSLLNIVALIAYMWIVIQFLRKRAKGDTAGLDQLKGMLLWGAVGMFFLVAVWGLTYFISTTTGIKVGGCTQLPAAPGQLVDNSKCNNSVSSFVYNGNTESSGSPSITRPPQTSTSQSSPGSPAGSGQPNNIPGGVNANSNIPYKTTEELDIFNKLSKTNQDWLTEGGKKPDITDGCILARLPDQTDKSIPTTTKCNNESWKKYRSAPE